MRKLLVYGLISILVTGGVLFVLWMLTRNTSSPAVVSNVPDYILSDSEQADLGLFVKGFASLYNTYRQDDLKNFNNMEEMATPVLVQKTREYAIHLAQTLPQQYEVITTMDQGSFSYQYPKDDTIYARIAGTVKETKNGSLEIYPVSAQLTLVKTNSRWLVDDIQISRTSKQK